MTMTRQHFALVALAVKECMAFHNAQGTVTEVAKNLAFHLAPTNPNFNRARFLRACGVED